MANSSVHMIELMTHINIVQQRDMAVQHQVDDGILTVFTSTSTTTMEDHMGL